MLLFHAAHQDNEFDSYKKSPEWKHAKREFEQYPALFNYIDQLDSLARKSLVGSTEANKMQTLAESRFKAAKDQQIIVEERYDNLNGRHKKLVERHSTLRASHSQLEADSARQAQELISTSEKIAKITEEKQSALEAAKSAQRVLEEIQKSIFW